MPKRRLPYKEGDWFAVPLEGGDYAIGVIARFEPAGFILGYFFGPRRRDISPASHLNLLRPEEAIYIRVFSDIGLRQQEWPIIPREGEWNREQWPIPGFGHIDDIDSRKAFRREYDENSLGLYVRETLITPDEARKLPEDGIDGYIALQIQLAKLLPPDQAV